MHGTYTMNIPGVSASNEGVIASKAPFVHVLHVEDNKDDQVLVHEAFKGAGVPTIWREADSAGEGISYLRALVAMGRMSPVALPDLVLLDAVMPRGGGFEVLRFIRNTPELKGLMFVVFSGGFDPDHREEAQRLGATLFLVKPLHFGELVKIAKELSKWGSQVLTQTPPDCFQFKEF